MGEIAAVAASMSCRSPAIFGGGGGSLNSKKAWTLRTWTPMPDLKTNAHHPPPPSPAAAATAAAMARSSASATRKPRSDITTFTSTVFTDIPLYEPNGVSFDEYLADRHRIFGAMFPDMRRSDRLNDEEWRIQMLPLQFLFASVSPVVVMRLRCKSGGRDYPPAIPLHVTRVLELQATRWELRGLDAVHMPSHFSLNVQGLLYSERNGRRQSRLKGSLKLSISMVLTPVLRLVPEDVLRSAIELVLKGLVDKMKDEVHGGLLLDFQSFGREKLMKHGTLTQPAATATATATADKKDLPASPLS